MYLSLYLFLLIFFFLYLLSTLVLYLWCKDFSCFLLNEKAEPLPILLKKAQIGVRSHWWRAILDKILHQLDVEEILIIKLSNISEEIVSWRYELSGAFSVQSAYKLALNWAPSREWDLYAWRSRKKTKLSCITYMWQHLWKTNIPPKVSPLHVALQEMVTPLMGRRAAI